MIRLLISGRVRSPPAPSPRDPLPIAQLGARARRARVRARSRLGEPEGPQPLAPRQRHQVVLLLLLGAEEVERARAERDVGGHGDARGGVRAWGDDLLREVPTGPANELLLRSKGEIHQPRFLSSSVSCGTMVLRSPTMPRSAKVKMGASGSLLMAMIVSAFCIPTLCWMAPEMPTAM